MTRPSIKAMTAALRQKSGRRKSSSSELLGSGSTLVNLAGSGDPRGCFAKGGYYLYIGDSSSGKTVLALSCLAEAALDPEFDNYRLIYDNTEAGARMDLRKFFGSKTVDRLEPPRIVDGEPVYSRYAEQFYYHVDDAIEFAKKNDKPFIYVEDSLEALDTRYAEKKFAAKKVEDRGGKESKGDFGDGKAGVNSRYIRNINAGLVETGSILIIIGQTRDNINAGMFEPQQTYAGGRALKFYANFEIWTSIAKRLKRTVRGKDRQIGINARVAIKKNRQTGKEWTVEVPMYWSYGIDDIGGCVDWLVSEKRWKKNKAGMIAVDGLGPEFVGRREQVVRHIEQGDLYDDLIDLVTEVWREIEVACVVERQPRYI